MGAEVQYYSVTLPGWISCKIAAVDGSSGAVQVDCKPGHWIYAAEQASRIRALPAADVYRYDAGDLVEFMDEGGHWVACRVFNVEGDGTVVLDTTPMARVPAGATAQRVRAQPTKPRALGESVEYYSARYTSWLSCTVTAAHPDGSIEISVKPGYRMSKEEQLEKVRSPVGEREDASKRHVGQTLEYNSSSAGGWIACRCTKVGEDGSIQIDMKPHYDISPEEQARKIRVPAARPIALERAPFTLGLEVDVLVGDAWVKTTVAAVEANGSVRLANNPQVVLNVEEQNERTRLPRDGFKFHT